MRLFRQEKGENWTTLVARIALDLQKSFAH
jgi:hypothetical protein